MINEPKIYRTKDISKLRQKAEMTGDEKIPVSKDAYITVRQIIKEAEDIVEAEQIRASEQEAAIRQAFVAGDTATLQSAKTYTDGRETEVRKDMVVGDAASLQSAKEHTAVREAAIRRDMTTGDATTLQSAEDYTDTSVAAEAHERTQGDAATLRSAKIYTDTVVADEAQKRMQGDASTLQSARSHIDTEIASERTARESGDRTTLQSAKEYVDRAIAELIDGSPAALDTLKELSAALGDDPNFAATVAAQIGAKVDKVTGKGLSTEDYTSAEKAKLAGVAAGANNYTHPSTHPASMITPDATHRFATDAEKAVWAKKADVFVFDYDAYKTSATAAVQKQIVKDIVAAVKQNRTNIVILARNIPFMDLDAYFPSSTLNGLVSITGIGASYVDGLINDFRMIANENEDAVTLQSTLITFGADGEVVLVAVPYTSELVTKETLPEYSLVKVATESGFASTYGGEGRRQVRRISVPEQQHPAIPARAGPCGCLQGRQLLHSGVGLERHHAELLGAENETANRLQCCLR